MRESGTHCRIPLSGTKAKTEHSKPLQQRFKTLRTRLLLWTQGRCQLIKVKRVDAKIGEGKSRRRGLRREIVKKGNESAALAHPLATALYRHKSGGIGAQ